MPGCAASSQEGEVSSNGEAGGKKDLFASLDLNFFRDPGDLRILGDRFLLRGDQFKAVGVANGSSSAGRRPAPTGGNAM